ncbi:MAG: hypothetical protein GY859_21705, partial [Desulfobacterales bacterium]|nr:hypothetical protein [Desulfobacterales bacterium]
ALISIALENADRASWKFLFAKCALPLASQSFSVGLGGAAGFIGGKVSSMLGGGGVGEAGAAGGRVSSRLGGAGDEPAGRAAVWSGLGGGAAGAAEGGRVLGRCGGNGAAG